MACAEKNGVAICAALVQSVWEAVENSLLFHLRSQSTVAESVRFRVGSEPFLDCI
jgi:hypothetical protein